MDLEFVVEGQKRLGDHPLFVADELVIDPCAHLFGEHLIVFVEIIKKFPQREVVAL
jgi:hypothetical protein